MKVGIAVQNNYPADEEVRARKVAKFLNGRGDSPVIFAREGGRYDNRPTEYTVIRRFTGHWAGPLAGLVTASVPINPFWICWFVYAFRRENLDVVVASNIRAGLPALVAATVLGIPAILDLQENNPEVVRTRPRETLGQRVARNPWLVDRIEQVCIDLADEIWVVVEERKNQLVERGCTASEIRVVSNTPACDEIAEATTDLPGMFDPPVTEFTMVYVGSITEFRGLDSILEAFPHMLAETDDVALVIAGDGPHLPALKERATELGVADSVHFLGWIAPETVPAVLAASDLGLIPHEVNDFTDTTVPNKLFDYMAVGLPVLATNMDPVARILRNTGAGRSLSSDPTPETIAREILELKSADLSVMAANGRRAIENTYNWQRESEVVLASLRSVCREPGVESQV